MIRSMISKTINSTITTLINPFDVSGLLSRYFVTLDPVLQSSYEMEQPITFTGDFEIEVEFSKGEQQATTFNVLTGFSTNEHWIATKNNNNVSVSIGGTMFSGIIPVLDGKLHLIKLTRVGNLVSLYVDGVLDGNTTKLGDIVFNQIGRNGSGHLFDGIIANVKFTDQSGASDVVTTFKLDQATANIEYSQENVFGSEEVVNGDFATDSDWTKGPLWAINNGTAIYSAVSGSGNISQSNTTTTGKSYVVTVDVIQNDGTCSLRTNNGTAVIGDAFTGTGLFSFVFLATGSQITFRAGFNTNPVIIDNLSVKEITNAVTYENIPQSARELYRLDVDTWTGGEEVTNGDFATDSDWNLRSGVSISQGSLISGPVSSGGFIADQVTLTPTKVGSIYQLTVVVSECVGQFNFNLGGLNPTTIGAAGTHTFYLTAINATSSVSFRARVNGITSLTVDNVSVKEIIEVAS